MDMCSAKILIRARDIVLSRFSLFLTFSHRSLHIILSLFYQFFFFLRHGILLFSIFLALPFSFLFFLFLLIFPILFAINSECYLDRLLSQESSVLFSQLFKKRWTDILHQRQWVIQNIPLPCAKVKRGHPLPTKLSPALWVYLLSFSPRSVLPSPFVFLFIPAPSLSLPCLFISSFRPL